MSNIGYGEGVTLGLLIADASNDGRSAARLASMDADIANTRAMNADALYEQIRGFRDKWRNEYYKMGEAQFRTSRVASVGLIFMNSFKQVLDNLPAEQADKLLTEIRDLTQARINNLDKVELAEANAKGERHISIQSQFEQLSQYKSLGFDKLKQK